MYLNKYFASPLAKELKEKKKKGPITVRHTETQSSCLCSRSHARFFGFQAPRKPAFSLTARLSCISNYLWTGIQSWQNQYKKINKSTSVYYIQSFTHQGTLLEHQTYPLTFLVWQKDQGRIPDKGSFSHFCERENVTSNCFPAVDHEMDQIMFYLFSTNGESEQSVVLGLISGLLSLGHQLDFGPSPSAYKSL